MKSGHRIFYSVAAGFFVMWFTAAPLLQAITGSAVAPSNGLAFAWLGLLWVVSSAVLWALSLLFRGRT